MKLQRMWSCLMVLILSVVLASCGGKSESDAKADVDKIWAIYNAYYATLEKNQATPAKGITEAQAFVDSKLAELGALATSLNENSHAMKVLENFGSEMKTRGEEEGKKWGAAYGKAGLTDKIQAQMMQFADAMEKGNASGASAGGGKAPSDVIDQVSAQALEQLKTQKDNFKSIPEANRSAVLTPFTESLKQAGASDAQIKDFESKAKKELGW